LVIGEGVESTALPLFVSSETCHISMQLNPTIPIYESHLRRQILLIQFPLYFYAELVACLVFLVVFIILPPTPLAKLDSIVSPA
jgi:hypothetical protein